MRVFSKSISERIWKGHLSTYSKTLVDYVPEIQKFVPIEHHYLLPYRIYLCPLCLKSYFIETDSGIIGNSEFSLDHLPPQSAGGSYKMITCKKCNNNAGIFESEIEKVLNFAIDKNDPESSLKLNVNLKDVQTGERIQGIAHHKDGRTDVQINENLKKYNKDYIEFLARLHSDKIESLEVEVSFYHKKKLERALIKSAYLLCFFWWGYEFVFSANGAVIRDVIAGKKDYPCQVPLTWLEGASVRPTGISILQDGNKRLAFVVYINLRGINVNVTVCILIPSPTEDGWTNISMINELNKLNQIKEFTCQNFPRIVDRIGYTISWNIIVPEKNTNY